MTIARTMFLRPSAKPILRALTHAAAGIVVVLLCSVSASAQYGGGGMAGTGTSAPGYSSPSYGSGKAIGIGVGAGAAGAVALYFALHHGASVTGCLQPAEDGMRLTDDRTGRAFSILPGDTDLQAGQRVQLKGKLSKDKEGAQVFQAKKVVKSLGACGAPASSQLAGSAAQ